MLASLLHGPRRFIKQGPTLFHTRLLSDGIVEMQAKHRYPLNSLLLDIIHDKNCKAIANSRYIDNENWESFLNNMRRNLIKDPKSSLFDESQYQELIKDMEYLSNPGNFTVPIKKVISKEYADKWSKVFLEHAEQELRHVIDANKILATSSSLNQPPQWYPLARMFKRKIIYHGGPTNSGKTYQAIERLKAADSKEGGGIYCGPLRLLALEIYEQLNRAGVSTNLVTGQEHRIVPLAYHTASTVEMVSTTHQYDVAVIDEIQMIADPQRGAAWTRALLGLRAREIHCCGGMEAAELVQSLCQSTGDDFEMKVYDRLSPLQVEQQSLRGNYSKVQAGDCIVAFTTAELFAIRKEIEKKTQFKCAIIYGQLPPETRSTQARLFNDSDSGYDILVASDAIGMGLNLNIRRIIFHTTLKRVGNRIEGSYYLDPFAVKQIAGRAGRKSSQYPHGLVTTWQEIDLAYVKAVLKWDVPQIQAAGVFPSVDQVNLFYQQLKRLLPSRPQIHKNDADDVAATSSSHILGDGEGDAPSSGDANNDSDSEIRLAMLIDRFLQLTAVDQRYFLCAPDTLNMVSNWLHPIPMSIADRFTFASAPVNTRDGRVMSIFYQFAAQYTLNRPVSLGVSIKRSQPKNLDEFSDLCAKHNIIDLYLWLAVRFPKNFIERELCEKIKVLVVRMVEKALQTKVMSNEANSFLEKYETLRSKLNGGRDYQNTRTMIMPPLEFGEILRDEVARNIAAIPPELRVVDLNRRTGGSSSDTKNKRRGSKGKMFIAKDRAASGKNNGNKDGTKKSRGKEIQTASSPSSLDPIDEIDQLASSMLAQ